MELEDFSVIQRFSAQINYSCLQTLVLRFFNSFDQGEMLFGPHYKPITFYSQELFPQNAIEFKSRMILNSTVFSSSKEV